MRDMKCSAHVDFCSQAQAGVATCAHCTWQSSSGNKKHRTTNEEQTTVESLADMNTRTLCLGSKSGTMQGPPGF